MIECDPLWEKLECLNLEALGGRSTYAERLAKENGWSASFTARVIVEYRRFLFLAVKSEHPVTPSTVVDEAWHLHLLYTESYWEDLCGGILKQPLHHGPTQGGEAEERKFKDWYRKTLSSYERIFRVAPPEDIWPKQKTQGSMKRYRLVDTSAYYLLPRVSIPRRPLLSVLALSGVGLSFAGAAGLNGVPVELQYTIYGIIGVLIVLLIVFISSSSSRRRNGSGHSSSDYSSSGCGGGYDSFSSHHGHHDGNDCDGGSDDSCSDGGGSDGGGDGGSCGSSCGGGCGGGGD